MTTQKHNDLKRLFVGVRNPTDIKPRHVEAFNIKYRSNVTISELIPDIPDGLIEETAFKSIVRDDFSLENDPCFRKVCRLPPEKGQILPRLSQAYLFFKSLEDMSRYWDNSKDKYFEKTENLTSTGNKNDKSKQSIQNPNAKTPPLTNGDTYTSTSRLYTGRRHSNAGAMPPHLRDSTLEGLLRSATQKFNAVCKPPTQQYTRLQIGELLIPVRQTLVVGRVPSDRAEARKMKTLGPMLVGSARGEIVFRGQGDERGKGQAEMVDFLRELGGLLLLAQQRNREGRTERRPGTGSECWWVTRERWGGGRGGTMPHEESEGGEEVSKIEEDVVMSDATRPKRPLDASSESGEAAAVSGETSTSTTNAPLVPALTKTPTIREAAAALPATAPPTERPGPAAATPRIERPPLSTRRMRNICEAWRSLKPPSALWDPNVTYSAIGKVDGKDGDWDDVFMVSCVNTHVCILKMRVSRGYCDWLETGRMSEARKEKKLGRSGIVLPMKEEKGMDWEGQEMRREVLYLERTGWWDLFSREERVEALGAIWRVLSWVCREMGGGKLPWEVE